jgi:hypothetical protein
MAVDPHRSRNHLVSKGYQQNFADAGRLAILSMSTGVIADSRPTKTNWVEDDFLTVIYDDGTADDSLEREYAKVERKVLNQIRDITATRITAEQKEALDHVAAIHLVRSLTFAAGHEELVEKWFNDSVTRLGVDPRVCALFEAQYGRQPGYGELQRVIASTAVNMMMGGGIMANGMRRVSANLPEILARWTVQLVQAPDWMPGFVLADQPIVHARPEEGRYGFRSKLAVGDANLLLMPIHRRLAAIYTSRPLPHFALRTKRGLRTINATFCRNAVAEVACHPHDALETSRLIRNLDRFPAAALHDGTLR